MDELQKALKEKPLSSTGFGPGTNERGWFRRNPVTGKFEKFTPEKPSWVNAPYVKRDESIEGIESPITGKVYHSKAALRQEYKDYGYIETGGEHLGKKPPVFKPNIDEVRDDVARALNDLKYGNVPLTEKEKQLNEEENRKWQSYRSNQ